METSEKVEGNQIELANVIWSANDQKQAKVGNRAGASVTTFRKSIGYANTIRLSPRHVSIHVPVARGFAAHASSHPHRLN